MLNYQEERLVLGGILYRDWRFKEETKLSKDIMKKYSFDDWDSSMSDFYRLTETEKNELKKVWDDANKFEEEKIRKIIDEFDFVMNKTATYDNYKRISTLAMELSEVNTPQVYSVDSIIKQYKNETIYKCNRPYLEDVVGEHGFHNERLYVFASMAKGGKSIVLQNLAWSLAVYNQDKKVLFLSLENNENDIAYRFINGFMGKVSQTTNLDIIYNPKASLTDIRRLSNNYDIIIVDYLARIVPEKRYESNYDMFGDFTDALHKIAADKKKLVITACQLSRSAMSKFRDDKKNERENFLTLDQDDIADSLNIIRNADTVIITKRSKDGAEQYFNNIACRTNNIKNSCSILYSTTYNLQFEAKKGYFLEEE